jgi:hypothetical protein
MPSILPGHAPQESSTALFAYSGVRGQYKNCVQLDSIEDWNSLYSRKRRKVSSILQSLNVPIASAGNHTRILIVATKIS